MYFLNIWWFQRDCLVFVVVLGFCGVLVLVFCFGFESAMDDFCTRKKKKTLSELVDILFLYNQKHSLTASIEST